MIIYLGLAAAVAGVLALRALYLGVCEHLEADDIPSTARERLQAARRAPAHAVSRRTYFPASTLRRIGGYHGLHLHVHR